VLLLFVFPRPQSPSAVHAFGGWVVEKRAEGDTVYLGIRGLPIPDDPAYQSEVSAKGIETRTVIVPRETLVEKRITLLPRKSGKIDKSEMKVEVVATSIDEIYAGNGTGQGGPSGSEVIAYAKKDILGEKEFKAYRLQINRYGYQ
jgi:hypothetical protein